MTQAQFARRIGVTQSYLSALEHGEKEPGSAVLLAISKEFGKSVDWLLTGQTSNFAKRSQLGLREPQVREARTRVEEASRAGGKWKSAGP
jgi:transcriptional regulator with XRE-family HTH domain